MARILLHYDIRDDVYRESVQKRIVHPNFGPQFRQVTESVYAADFSMIPREYNDLVVRLRTEFANPPPGTLIILERPDRGPNIVPEEIVSA